MVVVVVVVVLVVHKTVVVWSHRSPVIVKGFAQSAILHRQARLIDQR